MKKILVILLMIVVSTDLCAQLKLNVLGGADLSGGVLKFNQNSFVYNYIHQKTNAEGQWYPGLNLGLQLRDSVYWSVELGFQSLFFGHAFDVDPNYLSTSGGNSQYFFFTEYNSYRATFTKYFPMRYFNFYTSAGVSLNFHGFDWLQQDDNMQFQLSPQKQYWGWIAETGFNRRNLFVGFQYNQAFHSIYGCEAIQKVNGVVVNTDYISSNGMYMGVVVRCGFGLTNIELKQDETYSHQKWHHIYKLHRTKHKEK